MEFTERESSMNDSGKMEFIERESSMNDRLSGHQDPDMDQPLLILLFFPHCPLAPNHYPSFLGSKAWSMVCLPLILFGKIDSYLTQ